jgi:hypothetical protein
MESMNMGEDAYKVPQPGLLDHAHTATKAALSAVPVVGGPIAELVGTYISPPLIRRRDQWMESIADGLRELEARSDGFKLSDLSENETFITAVMHATRAALGSHQKEKLTALRNIVLNSTLPGAPDDDTQLMFLSIVDGLTPWHLKILQFLVDPLEDGSGGLRLYPGPMDSPAEMLEYVFPDLKGRRPFYDQVVMDLYTRGLLATDDLHVVVSKKGRGEEFGSQVTEWGKQFLEFVTSPV